MAKRRQREDNAMPPSVGFANPHTRYAHVRRKMVSSPFLAESGLL